VIFPFYICFFKYPLIFAAASIFFISVCKTKRVKAVSQSRFYGGEIEFGELKTISSL